MADEHAIIRALSSSIQTYNSYFQRILGTDNEGGWKKSNKDHYCFIPTRNVENIVRALRYLKTHSDISRYPKFLDCGCGIGNIMMLAEKLGFKPYGIEYEKENVALARTLLRGIINNRQIIHDDILKYKHYNRYDVIYYFEPLQNHEKRREFADKIAKGAKRGAFVIPNGEWGADSLAKTWEYIKGEGGSRIYKKL